MRIKVICPTFYTPSGVLFKPQTAMMPPLSILHLAGLIPNGHDVSVLDEAVQHQDFGDPVDLVGITTTSINARRAYEIADEYRRRGVRVAMGGIHASTLPDEALQHADSVVVGEAEDSWPQLVNEAAAGPIRTRYELPRRNSLAGLPCPRYDLIDPTLYVRAPFHSLPMLPIQTARGCPHNCDFCSVTRFWGRQLRMRPTDEVVEEIRRSRAQTIFFTDDNFFANPRRSQELCEALRPLGIRFFCQIDSTSRKREDLIHSAARAGCFLAFVGFESLSTSNLSGLNKQFNRPEEYAELIRILHANRIGVFASIMFGLEHDTLASVRQTTDFLIANHVEMGAFFRLTPFPGTSLFERMKTKGCIVDEHWWLHLGTGATSLIRYPNQPVGADELVKQANVDFYSWTSILRRFSLPRRPRLVLLLLNMQSRRKMLKSGGSCSF
jgi:radical SAM superfamily enzyme YgiQ (UPF0313 family)